jgi:rsbT co-antagonist protein RsbR
LTDQCVAFIRKLAPKKTHYVYRNMDSKLHPFKKAKLSIWGPRRGLLRVLGKWVDVLIDPAERPKTREEGETGKPRHDLALIELDLRAATFYSRVRRLLYDRRSMATPSFAFANDRAASCIERASLPVITCSPDLEIIDWNAGAERLFGHSKGEVKGRKLPAVIAPADAGNWKLTSTADSPDVRRAVHKDGRKLVCQWFHEPVLDEAGKQVAVLCFAVDMTERARVEADLKNRDHLLRVMLDNLGVVVWQIDRNGIFTFHDGKKALENIGMVPGSVIGLNVFDLYPSDDQVDIRRGLAGEHVFGTSDAHGRSWRSWVLPMRDSDGNGEVIAVAGVTLDVTDSKRIEADLRAKIELIEAQQQTIRELSTPIIEVWDNVLTLPMIGVIDTGRTSEVMEDLLTEIVRTRARFAILDLTGVEVVDTGVASHLINLIRSVQLLGAEGLITGVRPNVAQTMAGLGVDLKSVVTMATLREGLRYCMGRDADD